MAIKVILYPDIIILCFKLQFSIYSIFSFSEASFLVNNGKFPQNFLLPECEGNELPKKL